MSTSRTSHTSQQALLTAVADAYPDLHAMHLDAGRQAAARRDAKERKMPNDITFHNAATHYKGHKDAALDGSVVRDPVGIHRAHPAGPSSPAASAPATRSRWWMMTTWASRGGASQTRALHSAQFAQPCKRSLIHGIHHCSAFKPICSPRHVLRPPRGARHARVGYVFLYFFGAWLPFQVEHVAHQLLHVVAHRRTVFGARLGQELCHRGGVVALRVGRLRRMLFFR